MTAEMCPACKHPVERHYGRWCRVPRGGAVNASGQELICCCEAVDSDTETGTYTPTDEDVEALAAAVCEAYDNEGVGIWWNSWLRADEVRRDVMEAGVMAEWSGIRVG